MCLKSLVCLDMLFTNNLTILYDYFLKTAWPVVSLYGERGKHTSEL